MSITRCLHFTLRCSQRAYSNAPAMIRERRFSDAAGLREKTELSVTEGGKRLRAVWSGDGGSGRSTYHAVWLRHGCQCSCCVSEYKQLLWESHELDPHVKISEVQLVDGDVRMKWSCGHEGYVNLDWLKRHSYASHTLENRRKSIHPELGKQAILPEVDIKELESDKGVLRWLKMLSEHGVCLLTGIQRTKEAGLEITRKITPYLQETYYGGTSEVKVVENPINVAYSSHSLEAHMDVGQYESQPGLSIFQCVRFDECVGGGESIVVDLLAVMERLRVTRPHHFATLIRVPATFFRIHYKRDFPVHMIYRTPHVHLNRHGEIVKLRWCPQNHGPPLIPEEDVLPYYEAVTRVGKLVNEDKEFQVCQRLEPGQVLTINNHRMLHGRNAIKLNGGVRHLNNFQINIDEFKSRLALLCAKYDPDYEPKNVFNHDFSFSGVAQTVHI